MDLVFVVSAATLKKRALAFNSLNLIAGQEIAAFDGGAASFLR